MIALPYLLTLAGEGLLALFAGVAALGCGDDVPSDPAQTPDAPQPDAAEGNPSTGNGAGSPPPAAWTQITAGQYHTCARRADGEGVCWGHNGFRQLGAVTAESTLLAPTPILAAPGEPLTGIAVLDAGRFSNCARLSDATVRCWGMNTEGQGGNGTTENQTYPSPVLLDTMGSFLTGALQITVGAWHSCAVLTDRSLRCWGDNDSGALGNGAVLGAAVAVPVMASQGKPLHPVVQAQAGCGQTCAILEGGAIYCWGWIVTELYGEIDFAPAWSPELVSMQGIGPFGPTQLAVGEGYACALGQSGRVACWGWNLHGQLGNGTTESDTVPRLVRMADDQALDDVTAIAAGDSHTCALRGDGTVWCWGGNGDDDVGFEAFGSGQLGDGTVNDRAHAAPVLVPTGEALTAGIAIGAGEFHTCAILAAGMACWGANDYGQLGDGTTEDRYFATPVPFFSLPN